MRVQVIQPDTPRILPPLTETNTSFWTGGAHGELLILYCDACDCWVHPPVSTCPACAGPLTPRPARGTGTLFTFTINHHQYHPDVPPPYVVAIVELDEQSGLRLPTNIVHASGADLRCGMPVQVLFEQHGNVFVPVFEPAA
ncbi:MAG: Zn-ribbon domain-containing OB-fold protein [Acidimicrobiia bacterium]